MTDLLISGDRILVDGSVTSGWIEISDGRIAQIGSGAPARPPDFQAAGRWIVPGFVDIHVHGGNGAAFQGGLDRTILAASFHRAHGTTTLLASLVSAPVDSLAATVAALLPAVSDGTLAGIHLEGPFLSSAQCGAHNPDHLRSPQPADVDRLLDAGQGSVRMVTLAPELEGGVSAVERLVAAGVVAAIGHTDASYEQTLAALDAGASVATHLFNGMRRIYHRSPGPVVACMTAGHVAVELIVDGLHLHRGIVKAVQAAVGPTRTVLVTDAISAAGVGDGEYLLGAIPVLVTNGQARLASTGALAGSVITLDQALANAVTAGVPFLEAVAAVTTAPARAVGLGDRAGVIEVGRAADLVVLDEDLSVAAVLADGRWVVESARHRRTWNDGSRSSPVARDRGAQ